MSLAIKIVTTANRTRFFNLSNEQQAANSIESLTGLTNVFATNSLVFSSNLQAEVFSPRRIALIELAGDAVPVARASQGNFEITALDINAAAAPEYNLFDESYGRFRVDFFFVGGFELNTQVVVDNSEAAFADRTRRISQLFETPVICYHTSNGGLGLINPSVMTRAVITPGGEVMPADAIIVDDY
jgi:hypothetical protein